MSLDLTDDKSTMVQVMAWCHQAPSHYLNQCWPRSLLQCGITRPQWVNMNLHTVCALLWLDIYHLNPYRPRLHWQTTKWHCSLMYQQRCCHILVFIERNRIALGVQRFAMGANVICFTYHHQAPSHYLSQCWPRSLLQCGITRPRWVNMNLHTVCALLCFVEVRYLSF